MWQGFLKVLADQVVNQDDIEQAQNAAQQAFHSFRRWVIVETPESTR